MGLRYTAHALRQMSLRGIEACWIEMAVSGPDWTSPDPDPRLTPSFKAIEGFGGRILRVVHRMDAGDVLIVTAHFDRGAKP